MRLHFIIYGLLPVLFMLGIGHGFIIVLRLMGIYWRAFGKQC